MSALLRSFLTDHDSNPRLRLLALYSTLLAGNIGAWVWALLAFHRYPLLLGAAFLAYSFGLRHAVDADHIAAIDNTVRKLMDSGRRPMMVGFFFSLGHSTVVLLGSAVIAGATLAIQHRLDGWRAVGGTIGTVVSAAFLLLLAAANLQSLRGTLHMFRRARAGDLCHTDDLNLLLTGGGLLARVLRPLFRLIGESWHMYPIGILFGLGFDTATEIGLLSLSATETARGLSPWSVAIFPVLFAMGMCLVDTTDNVLMVGAYEWAFVNPIRKLYYNLTVTAISVLVAVVVSGIEVLGLVAGHLGLQGTFWQGITRLNEHFGLLGYGIIALFVLSWAVSVTIYKLGRFDDLEPST